MFCSKCGTENPEGTKFCTRCGAEFGAAAKPSASAIAMTPTLGMLIAVALGLLLRVIGMHAGEAGLMFAGAFILPLALVWGGLFLDSQALAVRVTLLASGGLVLFALFMQTAIALPW